MCKILLEGLCKVLLDLLCKVLLGGVSEVLLVLYSLFTYSERSRRCVVTGASLRRIAGPTVANVSSDSAILLTGVSLRRATMGGLVDTDVEGAVGKSERASSALINIEILA